MVLLISHVAVSRFLNSAHEKSTFTGEDVKKATWDHFVQRAQKEHNVVLCAHQISKMRNFMDKTQHPEGPRGLNIDTDEGFMAMIGFAKTMSSKKHTCNH